MSKHTPGPWNVNPEESPNEMEAFVIEAAERVVCRTANTYLPVEDVEVVTDKDEANAKLISAAPDLYAALRNLFDNDLIRGTIDSDHMSEVIDALSKADWTDR